MSGDSKPSAREAAIKMRELPEDLRDEAIDNSPNVVDLRGALHERRKNRKLAEGYRHAFSRKPPNGAA